jgi:hypothetical protein
MSFLSLSTGLDTSLSMVPGVERQTAEASKVPFDKIRKLTSGCSHLSHLVRRDTI